MKFVFLVFLSDFRLYHRVLAGDFGLSYNTDRTFQARSVYGQFTFAGNFSNDGGVSATSLSGPTFAAFTGDFGVVAKYVLFLFV